ncbi:hypothetical protein Bbelb_213150 [Branchiostoma belcheri]|nr:hypothetical protein Bbelb_213150 [Branchiostoma belcheri]
MYGFLSYVSCQCRCTGFCRTSAVSVNVGVSVVRQLAVQMYRVALGMRGSAVRQLTVQMYGVLSYVSCQCKMYGVVLGMRDSFVRQLAVTRQVPVSGEDSRRRADMTGSLFDWRECERRYALKVWRFTVTVGVTSMMFAAVHVNGSDGIRTPEQLSSNAECITLHEQSHRGENTAQGFASTSRDADIHIGKDKERSDDGRVHRSVLLTEDQRSKRNSNDRETTGQDKTASDDRRGDMATPGSSRGVSEVIKPEESYMEEPYYCPFFNNRAPSAQPNLRNCSWYQARSCCLQREIDIIFLATYPLSAASDECLKQLSFLYCYVCDPAQFQLGSPQALPACLYIPCMPVSCLSLTTLPKTNRASSIRI